MKKIGFIDHHIDEFHSNLYVTLFRKSRFKDRMDVAFAYEEKCVGGMNIDQWSERYNVKKLNSPEEVVAQSDYIIVLSPDNSERHRALADYALKSGKPTYVDKTFAPDVKTAIELIQLAELNGTPMFSTSALRYAEELNTFIKDVKKDNLVSFVSTRGPNKWNRYAVHQIEMFVMLMGIGAKRAMQIGKKPTAAIVLDYDDNRSGMVNAINAAVKIGDKTYQQGFEVTVTFENKTSGNGATSFAIQDPKMFDKLIDVMGEFFETGKVPVLHEETLEVMRIIEAGDRAIETPFTWIKV